MCWNGSGAPDNTGKGKGKVAFITRNPILRETAHTLAPTTLLYALYVQFHGDYGPGGGFQAGVIFSVGLILYALTYGIEKAQAVLSRRTAEVLSAFGVLLYALTGVVSLLRGAAFLDYSALAQQPLSGQHLGIFAIELGVGVTIVGVVMLIFYLLMDAGEAA